MIYRQHNVEEAVPAMMEMALPVGLSSSFCSAAVVMAAVVVDSADVAAATAAASSGFC